MDSSTPLIHEWNYFQAKHSILLDHLIFRQFNSHHQGNHGNNDNNNDDNCTKNELSQKSVIQDALTDIFKYSQENLTSKNSIPLMVGYIRQSSESDVSNSNSKIYEILSNQQTTTSNQKYLISIGDNLKVDTHLVTLSSEGDDDHNQQVNESKNIEIISRILMKNFE